MAIQSALGTTTIPGHLWVSPGIPVGKPAENPSRGSGYPFPTAHPGSGFEVCNQQVPTGMYLHSSIYFQFTCTEFFTVWITQKRARISSFTLLFFKLSFKRCHRFNATFQQHLPTPPARQTAQISKWIMFYLLLSPILLRNPLNGGDIAGHNAPAK
jgi:hypothetical protein